MHMFIINITNLIGMNLEIGNIKVGVGGETTSPIRNTIRRFPKDKVLS